MAEVWGDRMAIPRQLRIMAASAMMGTLKCLSCFSLLTIQRVGWVLGSILMVLPTGLKEVSRKNVAVCFPNETVEWREKLVRESIRNTAITMIEYAVHWFWPMEKIARYIMKPDDAAFQRYEAARAHGKGVILMSPHMGSWESMLGYLPLYGRATMMYRPLRMASLEKVVRSARERAGAQLVPATAGGIREMLKALKRNEIVVMLPDQVPSTSGGVVVPFFGVPALTMTLASKLSQRTGARVMIGYAARLGLGEGYQPDGIDVSEAFYSDDPIVSATALNEALETVIRRYLNQYVWSYKRFKRRGMQYPKLY